MLHGAALNRSDHPARWAGPAHPAELQTFRSNREPLPSDVRALSALVHAVRGALVATGLVKGGA